MTPPLDHISVKVPVEHLTGQFFSLFTGKEFGHIPVFFPGHRWGGKGVPVSLLEGFTLCRILEQIVTPPEVHRDLVKGEAVGLSPVGTRLLKPPLVDKGPLEIKAGIAKLGIIEKPVEWLDPAVLNETTDFPVRI